MQCVLSFPYLFSSAVTEVHVRVLACACVRLWLHSCLRGGNIMYPISPSFHFTSCGQLTELPSTFQLFYWAEMFSLAWRVAENPPNYTCHAAWSCPPWQCGPTKWFMRLLSRMEATPLILQHYREKGEGREGGVWGGGESSSITIDTDMVSIYPPVNPAFQLSKSIPLAQKCPLSSLHAVWKEISTGEGNIKK